MLKYIKAYLGLLFLLMLPIVGICQLKPSVPQWVLDIGGPGSSIVSSSKVDKQNNVYITGIFQGTIDFDPSSGVKNLTSNGGSFDIYVAKYDTNGALIWAVSMGGSGIDQPDGLAVDANGNVCVVGLYQSGSFDADPGPGVSTLTNIGGSDIFIINLDVNGNFLWAKSVGGTGTDYANKVAIDSQGNRVIACQFSSSLTIGTTNFPASGAFNGLALKYDAAGNFIWGIDLGQTGTNIVSGVAIDSGDNILLGGALSGTVNYNPLGAAQNVTATGSSVFTAKYTPAGQLIWVQPATGGINSAINICVDSKDNVYDISSFSSSLTFNGTGTINAAGNQDIALWKYSPAGTLLFSKGIGGSGATVINYDVTVSNDDYIYIAGSIIGTVDFDPSVNVALIKYHGQEDLCLSKYDVNGNYQWAIAAGNNSCSNNLGRTVAVDNNNDVLFAGCFCSTVNFDFSNCTNYILTAQSSVRDIFLAKYVPSPPAISNTITAPAVTSFCGNGDAAAITGSTPTGGNGTFTYQWQNSTNGIAFTNISGATAKDYDPPILSATTYYLRNVSSGTCVPAASNVVTITIAGSISSNIITAPVVTTFCASGDPAVINGNTLSGGSYTYQWQSSADNVTFTDIAGATSATYDPPQLNATTYYHRVVTSGGCSLASNTVTITINPNIANNNITAPATSVFCGGGDPAITGSTPTGGGGAYTYQWQSSTDNVTFSNISGAVAVNYDPPTITTTMYYRRTVISVSCIQNSNVVTITIQPNIANNNLNVPAITTFCISGDPAPITGVGTPTGGNGTFTYQWQSRSGNASFSDIPGATSATYDPPVITATTYYHRLIASGSCQTSSNLIIIRIDSAILNNNITAPATTTFCGSGDPGVISGSTPTGGNGTFNYQWQLSTDNINFADIAGATNINYDPPSLSATTYYRRWVTSGVCISSISNVVVITINTSITAIASTDTTICLGGSASLTASGGTSYVWSPATGLSNTNIANPIASPATTTTYTVTASNGTCSSTAFTTITVIPKPVVSAGDDRIIVLGDKVQLNATATGSNLQYNWVPATGLSNPNILNPIATPSADITYTLYVTSPNNCFVVTDDVFIKVYPPLSIPNTFTPNNDSINDTWNITGLGYYSDCLVQIYNRFGTRLFKSIGYNTPWDGKYNGYPVPVGIYYYIIDLKNHTNALSGWVMVLR
ncbi:gliding motility-associated C-terminal domain-containing protein [Mucilaginibacter sp. AW1-3]